MNNATNTAGNLLGFNVTCTAANKMATETFSLRATRGLTLRDACDELRILDNSFSARGWTVSVEQVVA